MKKYFKLYALGITLAGIAACNSGSSEKSPEEKQDSSRLSAELVTNPRTAEGTDPAALAEMATMDFKDTVHDFGMIKEGEVVMYEFEFTNHGKSPLVITDANGSCGCTVPTFPRDPVGPGKSGVMKVRFDSKNKSGLEQKNITVKTNSVRGTHMLYIKAQVEAAKK